MFVEPIGLLIISYLRGTKRGRKGLLPFSQEPITVVENYYKKHLIDTRAKMGKWPRTQRKSWNPDIWPYPITQIVHDRFRFLVIKPQRVYGREPVRGRGSHWSPRLGKRIRQRRPGQTRSSVMGETRRSGSDRPKYSHWVLSTQNLLPQPYQICVPWRVTG